MIKIVKKMTITTTLLVFSYLIVVSGIGVGSLWMIFKFKDTGYFIYGFLILVGSVLLAALIRMFANIGQIMFDIRVDIQNSFKQVNELNRELNQDLKAQLRLQEDLKAQLQLQADTLNQNLLDIIQNLDQSSHEARKLDQELNQDLKAQLQLQTDTLSQNLLDIIQNLDQSSHEVFVRFSHEAKELSQKLAAIKDNFDQMNCDSKDMNQNIHQIRNFFEQIEKHLDLKK